MTRRHSSPTAAPWTQQRIDALRMMAGEFIALIEEGPADAEISMHAAVLGGALAGMVPSLLDEIERLRDAGQPMRGQMVKMDSRGGNA